METAAKYFSMLALLAGLAVIVLKPGQQELLKVDTVISSLLRYEANHAADYIRPRVAVGFGACRDLFVTAAHVMANTSFPAHPASYPGVASKAGDEQEGCNAAFHSIQLYNYNPVPKCVILDWRRHQKDSP